MSRDLYPRPDGTYYNLLGTHSRVPDEKSYWRVIAERDPSRESLVNLAKAISESDHPYGDFNHFAIETVEVRREILEL